MLGAMSEGISPADSTRAVGDTLQRTIVIKRAVSGRVITELFDAVDELIVRENGCRFLLDE